MHEREELKIRMIQELNQRKQEEIEFQERLKEIEHTAKKFLTNDAVSRYSTLKIAHPEIAAKSITAIYQAVQSGYINKKLDDTEFKSLLVQIQEERKEFKITKR